MVSWSMDGMIVYGLWKMCIFRPEDAREFIEGERKHTDVEGLITKGLIKLTEDDRVYLTEKGATQGKIMVQFEDAIHHEDQASKDIERSRKIRALHKLEVELPEKVKEMFVRYFFRKTSNSVKLIILALIEHGPMNREEIIKNAQLDIGSFRSGMRRLRNRGWVDSELYTFEDARRKKYSLTDEVKGAVRVLEPISKYLRTYPDNEVAKMRQIRAEIRRASMDSIEENQEAFKQLAQL